MGFEDLDHLGGQMTIQEMTTHMMNKKKKNKKKHKNKTTTTTTTEANIDSIASLQQQEQLQRLIVQMQQHLQQQQQQQQPSFNGVSNFQNSGNDDLPQYNPTNRPFQQPQTVVTFPSSSNQFSNPTNRPVSASFPFTPVQNSPTQRPIQNQYVSSTTFSDGLAEYNSGQAQYGSTNFQDDLPHYNPSQRPNIVSTSAPIEQAQYNIVSKPSQAQYGQNNQNQAQYSQTNQDLPQYFGNSNFRESPKGESWFPVQQNQEQYQSSYLGASPSQPTYSTPSPAISFEGSSKPVRFPTANSQSLPQYPPSSRVDAMQHYYYEDEVSISPNTF